MLQGAGRRVAGADTNDYPAGVQRTGRPDRIRRLSREHVHMLWKSRRILPSATSCGASRDGHRIGCRWSSRTCASATGADFWLRGVLLHHERQHHGRCHTSVSSGARTYWRQPVVIQFSHLQALLRDRTVVLMPIITTAGAVVFAISLHDQKIHTQQLFLDGLMGHGRQVYQRSMAAQIQRCF